MFTLSKYTTLARYCLAKTKNKNLISDENIGYLVSFALSKDKQYNPDRCPSKLKFTKIMMNYAVGNILEKMKRDSVYKSNQDIYLDNARSKDNPLDILIKKEILTKLKNEMSSNYYSLLDQYFLESRTLEDIAKERNCTRENIRQQLERALIEARSLV